MFFLKMGLPHCRMEFTRTLIRSPLELQPGYHLLIGRSETTNLLFLQQQQQLFSPSLFFVLVFIFVTLLETEIWNLGKILVPQNDHNSLVTIHYSDLKLVHYNHHQWFLDYSHFSDIFFLFLLFRLPQKLLYWFIQMKVVIKEIPDWTFLYDVSFITFSPEYGFAINEYLIYLTFFIKVCDVTDN